MKKLETWEMARVQQLFTEKLRYLQEAPLSRDDNDDDVVALKKALAILYANTKKY